jgi:hypothetical protein
MGERGGGPVPPHLRGALPARSEGVHMSERASESVLQRLREAPPERSEGVR